MIDGNRIFMSGGWVTSFLDNHDFARMVSRFGNDNEYHRESAKLLSMLILTMPGTPCIYFGSEIGMTNVAFDSIDDYQDVETLNFYKEHIEKGGDPDAFLKIVYEVGRDNVRTPMHWDDSRNAGFSNGTPWIKMNPNYTEINVQKEVSNSHGIHTFYKMMIDLRKSLPTLTLGKYEDMLPDHESIFAYRREGIEDKYIVVLNMSDEINVFDLSSYKDIEVLVNNYERTNYDGKLAPWEAYLIKQ